MTMAIPGRAGYCSLPACVHRSYHHGGALALGTGIGLLITRHKRESIRCVYTSRVAETAIERENEDSVRAFRAKTKKSSPSEFLEDLHVDHYAFTVLWDQFIFDDGRIVKETGFFRTFCSVKQEISNTTFRDLQSDLFFRYVDLLTKFEEGEASSEPASPVKAGRVTHLLLLCPVWVQLEGINHPEVNPPGGIDLLDCSELKVDRSVLLLQKDEVKKGVEVEGCGFWGKDHDYQTVSVTSSELSDSDPGDRSGGCISPCWQFESDKPPSASDEADYSTIQYSSISYMNRTSKAIVKEKLIP
ncbi:hypothetical protein J6590_028649 [Homalodisca vitripennis]|nr:hypothetical protein J6590_028649 [Homalodisca vitripennis]